MFLPTTKEEMQKLGWERCDVILVTGDAYIDSPYVGVAVIGHVLMDAGYKVGIIAQPSLAQSQEPKAQGNSTSSPELWAMGSGINDISRLGEPRLFWGVSGGCVDSMVSNYTALKKPRRSDDFTPGGENTKRPDRAVITYSNLIRRCFKNTVPIVLGGIEASLRRMVHYDYWQDGLRKSILFDAKADVLVYGMGERAVVEIANALSGRSEGGVRSSEFKQNRSNFEPRTPNSELNSPDFEPRADVNKFQLIKGICYISKTTVPGYIELPSFDEVIKDKAKFMESFKTFYDNNDPGISKGLMQKQDTRYLIQNPPQPVLTEAELDKVYELPFEYEAHPYYADMGRIKAQDTIKFSINTHRGCFGECNFCAITTHQGRIVTSRSAQSVIREAERITHLPGFKGYIYDAGGPTANMYRMGCSKIKNGHCRNKRCVFPEICDDLDFSHKPQMVLLETLRRVKGIKKIFIGSGLRYDMITADEKYGDDYIKMLVEHHISGQIKLAPEHSEAEVLRLMGKPGVESLKAFKDRYFIINKETGNKQFLTYYIIAAHPGCEEKDMHKLKMYLNEELQANPEQVQVFTPTPGTWSGVMYYTETDPFTGKHVFVEKTHKGKERQKEVITGKTVDNRKGWKGK